MSLRAAALDDPVRMRRADAELLSLALIEARNLTLRWLEVFETRELAATPERGASAASLAAHAGWYQDRWIGRHLQCGRGERADPAGPRLASAEPQADDLYARGLAEATAADGDAVRAYLSMTIDTTLELLGTAAADDAALLFFRLALLHEDRIGERLAEAAATLQLAQRGEPSPPWQPQPSRPERDALWLPPQRFAMGSERGGLVPGNERWAHEVAVPEFEIDAQPVTWTRFVEFADDGGYDRAELWSPAGWQWAQAQARRAPRDVEQLRGGVVLQRQGQLQRAAPGQAVLHVTRHEAEAWCRWAGRRLPTEPEWELAALRGAGRGFAWGDVFEWVAGSARPWPGHDTFAGDLDTLPAPGSAGVLRGASWLTPPRWRHPKARRFARPDSDAAFCGFRSCSV